jgi:hypothetical protein
VRNYFVIRVKIGQKKALLLQNGAKIASFPVDGVKWWKELFGDVYEIEDTWDNIERAAKAYLFAKLYPFARSPVALVKLLRGMDEFEAIYWMFAIRAYGMRGIAAAKKLFSL